MAHASSTSSIASAPRIYHFDQSPPISSLSYPSRPYLFLLLPVSLSPPFNTLSRFGQDYTPLEYAVMNNHVECIPALLAALSPPRSETIDAGPFLLAASKGSAAAMELLLRAKSNIAARNVSAILGCWSAMSDPTG